MTQTGNNNTFKFNQGYAYNYDYGASGTYENYPSYNYDYEYETVANNNTLNTIQSGDNNYGSIYQYDYYDDIILAEAELTQIGINNNASISQHGNYYGCGSNRLSQIATIEQFGDFNSLSTSQGTGATAIALQDGNIVSASRCITFRI